MVRHFGQWVGEAHDIEFTLNGSDFTKAMRRRADDRALEREEMWGLIQGFFPAEMARQTLVPHAREALLALSRTADIVILTNLQDVCRQPRIDQLAAFGIDHRVECNQGGKGEPVARLVAEHGPSATVFVDDLAVHHDSVAQHAPQVHRLHMIAEPDLARVMPPAPAAHARIDDWPAAQAWIEERFATGAPAGGG
ncbi:HAD family hydrolase [Sphingomonas gilva]|uniref:HAD family hydrolase n=1 Tax=Sphingomonas gilva TaxID=2305907 RepID=A0A396RS65_9SPHN|nr:HAD family hydrolase [Sphingomonas gilva]RHW19408.1 HAD family hydrolase [Sphingomonas gilva]